METQVVKSCCAKFYASDAARLLLGDSFHPGGDRLTEQLGRALSLSEADRVLDVACGNGHTALTLARKFGCSVVGVDYSADNVRRATEAARAAGVHQRVTFVQGDAEDLPIAAGAFDALVCECAFCTFPDKAAGAREMRRVLAPDGRLGLSDVTLERPLPPEVYGQVADLPVQATWVLCLADARPADGYRAILAEAGFVAFAASDGSWALREMIDEVGRRLMAIELAQRFGGLPEMDWGLHEAAALTRQIKGFVDTGGAGYLLLTARAKSAAKKARRR